MPAGTEMLPMIVGAETTTSAEESQPAEAIESEATELNDAEAQPAAAETK